MKIVIEPELMLRLQSYAAAIPDEFSGFGFCELEKDVIRVYDFVLLNVGSYAFTEIPTSKILPIMERSDAGKCKVWLHRHPMGSGVPGPENWSGTDVATIKTGPLGSVPELVKWSVSIVLTPRGWVGRIDNYVTGKTVHLEVEPQAKTIYAELAAIKSEVMATLKPFQREARVDAFGQLIIRPSQTKGALSSQAGRSRIEELFDTLNEIQASLEQVQDSILEAATVLGETKDDLYSEVDDLLNTEVQDDDVFYGESGLDRNNRLEVEIEDEQEEFDFGGARGSH